MKSQTPKTMSRNLSNPMLRIATDQRTWILAGALAAAGGRVLRRWRKRFDLQGRTVLITGGTRGLGLELARQAGLAGARVAICGRDADTLARARESLSQTGAAVLAVTCDVTDRNQVAELIRSVQAGFGHIDVLINNAGMVEVGPVGVMTAADFERDMATNFWGPLNVILAVLPHMRPRGEGRIVNIASIGGKLGVPHLVPYSSSKFALVGLSEGLHAELQASGILVTTVCPGLMRTGSPRHATFKGRHDAEFTWFSLADNAPLLSMDVARAARRILERHPVRQVARRPVASGKGRRQGPRVVSGIDLGRARSGQPLAPQHREPRSRRGRPALPTDRLGALARRAWRPGGGTAQPGRLRGHRVQKR